jgi:hypothetical protein
MTAFDRFKAWREKNVEQLPSVGAQMSALWRQGREDFLNALMRPLPDSMQLSREPGAPGSPTPQMTTADLYGRTPEIEMDR